MGEVARTGKAKACRTEKFRVDSVRQPSLAPTRLTPGFRIETLRAGKHSSARRGNMFSEELNGSESIARQPNLAPHQAYPRGSCRTPRAGKHSSAKGGRSTCDSRVNVWV